MHFLKSNPSDLDRRDEEVKINHPLLNRHFTLKIDGLMEELGRQFQVNNLSFVRLCNNSVLFWAVCFSLCLQFPVWPLMWSEQAP